MSEVMTKCDDCGAVREINELDGYRDFWSRTEVGQEIPAGDCPDCGAFAYLIREKGQMKCDICGKDDLKGGHLIGGIIVCTEKKCILETIKKLKVEKEDK